MMELVFTKPILKENIFIKYFPYLLIVAFSFVSAYPLFYEGYPLGDDYAYHFSSVLDLYTELKEGYSNTISANLASGYGIAKVLFYAPLSHSSNAILALILNGNIILAFKINYIFSVIVSGMVTYVFAYKLSKNRFIALIGATFFIFYPYRLFDAICRIAYAEAYAFMFIPVFFLGIYEFANLDKCKIKPFIEIIIGAAGLYLSHNITALFAYAFGFIFLLFYIDKIFKLLIKDKRTIIYAVITVVITLAFASIVLLSSFELLSLDYYNVSDKERMWTSRDYVTNRTDYLNYSGFLNYNWLSAWNIEEISTRSLVLEIVFFISLVITTFIISFVFKKFIFKKYYYLVAISYYAIICGIFARRLELVLGCIIFGILYLLSVSLFNTKNKLKVDRFGYIYFGLIILTLLMICFSFIWQIIPEIFLTIQFPWRLWAFFSFFSAIFLSYFISRFRFLIPFGIFISAFLLVVSQPLVEKRTVHDNSNDWLLTVDEGIYKKSMSTGANLEYLPKSFYYNYHYESEYKKSIHDKIQNEVDWHIGKNPYKYGAQILEGSAKVTILNRHAPDYVLKLEAEDTSLIQMPLFYYPGYKIKAKNLDTNESINIEVLDIDSLISFKIDKGNYEIYFEYAGTNMQHLGKILFKSSFALIILFYGFDIIYENKKNRKLLK